MSDSIEPAGNPARVAERPAGTTAEPSRPRTEPEVIGPPSHWAARARRPWRAVRPRLRYLAAAVPLGVAAGIYGRVMVDELTYANCGEYPCEPFGSYYRETWLIFVVAAAVSAGLLKLRSIVRHLESLMSRRPTVRHLTPGGLSLSARAAVGAALAAGVLVLVAIAAQRVIRPEDTEAFTSAAFLASGLAIYGTTAACLIGVCQPRLLARPLPGLGILGRATHRDVLSVAVVSATFVLTIYSSEVWTAMLVTPWYTVALIFLILVAASVVMVGQNPQPSRGAAMDQQAVRRRPIAGRSRRTATASGSQPTRSRPGGPPHNRRRSAWANPLLLAAVFFVGFFVLTIDLLDPETVRTVVDGTANCGYPNCAEVPYPSMVAKIAALLAALTTLVAAESKSSNKAS